MNPVVNMFDLSNHLSLINFLEALLRTNKELYLMSQMSVNLTIGRVRYFTFDKWIEIFLTGQNNGPKGSNRIWPVLLTSQTFSIDLNFGSEKAYNGYFTDLGLRKPMSNCLLLESPNRNGLMSRFLELFPRTGVFWDKMHIFKAANLFILSHFSILWVR